MYQRSEERAKMLQNSSLSPVPLASASIATTVAKIRIVVHGITAVICLRYLRKSILRILHSLIPPLPYPAAKAVQRRVVAAPASAVLGFSMMNRPGSKSGFQLRSIV